MAAGDLSRFSQEIQIFADQVQEFENSVYDVATKRGVGSAEGQTLDYVGEIAGQSRPFGMTDENYRALIRWKIQLNRSGGEPNTLLDALKIITGADEVRIVEATGFIQLSFSGGTVPDDLYSKMKRVVSGGVSLQLSRGSSTPFRFDSATNGFDNGQLTQKLT
jgi:hypothetical protein